MKLSKALYLCEILILLMYGEHSEAYCGVGTSHFTVTKYREVLKMYKGTCSTARVYSEIACATHCFHQSWCTVYIIPSTCHQTPPELCDCHICEREPDLHPKNIGTLTVGLHDVPRQIDGEAGSWSMVSPACLQSVTSIKSKINYIPIRILEFSGIEATGSTTRYRAVPKCPPRNKQRGEIYCNGNDGVWFAQDTLACYPVDCYQVRGVLQFYAGTQNVTKRGYPCMLWTDGGPVTNNKRYADYPFDNDDQVAAKNYCRVFLGDEGRDDIIWCYNANYNKGTSSVRWDVCSVPDCDQ